MLTQHEKGGCQLVAVLAQQHESVLAGGLPVLLLAEVPGQEVRLLRLVGRAEEALHDCIFISSL